MCMAKSMFVETNIPDQWLLEMAKIKSITETGTFSSYHVITTPITVRIHYIGDYLTSLSPMKMFLIA